MFSREMASRFLIIGLVFLMISACASEHQSTQKKPKKALNPIQLIHKIEDAQFTNFAGDTVGVNVFRGKVVMIDFWETWCKPCINSFPAVQRVMEEYPDNFTVLAVNSGWKDDKNDAKDFVKDNDYSFNYLMDTMDLRTALGIHTIPYKIFLGPDGSFIKTEVGSKGRQKDYQKIKEIVKHHK